MKSIAKKRKIDKLDFSKIKNKEMLKISYIQVSKLIGISEKTTLFKEKGKLSSGKKYYQNTY